jgi:hypothetical protein
MINRLVLRNWKSYAELSVDFVAGCNFLVAENGVGKTGLIQAIYFGLFGDDKLLGSRSLAVKAIRGRVGGAHVELVVTLADRTWTVGRDLYRAGEQSRVESSFHLDGAVRAETDWLAELASVSLVDPVQLRLLCAIPEGSSSPAELDAQDRYDLVAHLSSVLGATKLTALGDQYETQSIAVAKEADRIRLTVRDRPGKESGRQLESLRGSLGAAKETRDVAKRAEGRLRSVLTAHKLWTEWDVWATDVRGRSQAALREWTAVFEEAGYLLGRDVQNLSRAVEHELEGAAGLAGLLRQYAEGRELAGRMVADLRDLYSERTGDLAALEAEAAASNSSIDLLSQPGAICPTCLRPMNDAERADAIDRNRERTAGLQPRIDALRQEQTRVVVLGRRMAAIAEASVLDVRPAPTDPRPVGDMASAEELFQDATLALADREADVRRLEQEIGAAELYAQSLAENDALSNQLMEMYRRSDVYLMVSMTFRRVADAICAGRLGPLAAALAKRWNEIWPERPKIGLDPHGALTADANGAKLNLVDLSGGERAVAMVLLRILAAQSASRCPFLLLDEPLEHLDPANRRMLANLLTAASRSEGTPSRQLIVTTYEETVARRLGQAGHTEVIYVRSSGPRNF